MFMYQMRQQHKPRYQVIAVCKQLVHKIISANKNYVTVKLVVKEIIKIWTLGILKRVFLFLLLFLQCNLYCAINSQYIGEFYIIILE